jgi:hypothetical protein
MKVAIAVDDRSHEAARVAKELFPQADHIIVSATDSDQLMVAEPIGGGIISTGYSAESLIAGTFTVTSRKLCRSIGRS